MDIPWRLKLTYRPEGYCISTIKSFDNWYGPYETAIRYYQLNWRIVASYESESEALEGHEKICNMNEEELSKLQTIDLVED